MPKRKKKIIWFILVPVLVLAALSVATYYFTDLINKPRFVRYPAFSIDLPVSYQIHGIDVSHHQNAIDWKAVQQMQDKNVRIGFTFMKATEGLGRVDDTYRRNWYQAKREKLPRGAYHFFISSKSGKAQAENFIETVVLEKGDLPPVLDVEQTNGASAEDIRSRVKDWLVRIEQHYRVKPVIYTNVDFYESFLAGYFDDYPLWVAHYFVKNRPRIKRNWIFWQHSEQGRVNGIVKPVDFNVFNGDSIAFRRLLLK